VNLLNDTVFGIIIAVLIMVSITAFNTLMVRGVDFKWRTKSDATSITILALILGAVMIGGLYQDNLISKNFAIWAIILPTVIEAIFIIYLVVKKEKITATSFNATT